ncbi:uncharacterized protein SPPG_00830 [Spizellomyces punctatus DAOM BR117]|uniref:Fatty acid desaturase domain-containing protein n=1 Tax=Spizellomyces punctatus (strain DAOM BR117) TaxID=645134 RepID=A0A0L0HVQ3_SPIPD|nr:uncharacterized protein SPPG_00830 [Spizellomyces punctatus DAOM BR117]KND05162.1 hypothetical protein SPPG_00830 [Spizellomyces punctatus DAOM BR117]|eukprot:XP_016613201.1 hypothetical protein SPPG_00830 [Spizellomyces punctatus DAOM BR117]
MAATEMSSASADNAKRQHPGSQVNLSSLRKSLPPRVFEKSLALSMGYFVFDALVLGGLYLAYSTTLCSKASWSALEWCLYAVWVQAVGFFMWSLFCIGHDCGHGSFSDSKSVNAVVGHLSHGYLLVPFWPWARSHAQHHAYHNHKDKDMSHPWLTPEEETPGAKLLKDQPFLVPFAYGFGYILAGIPDGSHFVPWSPLFRNNKERAQCVVSSGVVFLYFVALRLVAKNWTSFAYGYAMPWLVYNAWLYIVTYLQHHTAETRVYSSASWTFTTGAVETVDREYTPFGFLDKLMHNITNGHVVHHLFYTSIPHYRLMEATPVVAETLGKSYRRVDGFPFLEFLKSHWHSTRALLTWVPEEGIWTLQKQESRKNL